MRTTLTIEEDVAAILEQLRKTKKVSLKALVNEALRQGLRDMTKPARRVKPYRTRAISLGRCLIGSVDDVAEALALAEGEDHR